MNITLEGLMVFLLVTLRMTGIFALSPIGGRQNVPTRVNVGLSLVLAVVITSAMPVPALPELTLVNLVFLAFIEILVGVVAGFVLHLFLSVMIVGGEIIDLQLGLGMAKTYDPGSNASIALTATMLNALFILSFFLTNNHLTLIQMAAGTYRIIPLGSTSLNPTLFAYLPSLFSSVLLFAVKLCLPVVVLEVVVTMAVGIIMRIIPQINIFVVNIQLKLLIGLFALIVLVVPFMGFVESMVIICFERIQQAWELFLL